MSKINNSFALARTNPKLTGNYRITMGAEDQITLNTINANRFLNQNDFKNFKINANENLASAIARLFGNGAIKNNIIFETGRENSDDVVLDAFNKQYEHQYNYGLSRLLSEQYVEEFSIFSPLSIVEDIPKYFVIFRVEGANNVFPIEPVRSLEVGLRYRVVIESEGSILHNGVTYQGNETFVAVNTEFKINGDANAVIDDFDYSYDFLKNEANFLKFISDSEIIKTYDLTRATAQGRFLRDHIADRSFNADSIFVDWNNSQITYNGIDVVSGVITDKVENMDDIIANEIEMINFDEYITQGFERLGLISSNILNLEFAFSDNTAEPYKFYRYFGLYLDDLQLGKFTVDVDETFRRGTLYPSLYPFLKCIPKNYSQEFTDEGGIKLLPDLSSLEGVTIDSDFINTSTSIFYAKDVQNKLHKLENLKNTKQNEYILNDKSININEILGFDEFFQYPAKRLTENGIASTIITVNKEFNLGEYIDVYDETNRRLGRLIPDHLPLWNDNAYPDYIEGDYGEGKSLGYYFFPTGTTEQIAQAIAGAIRYLIGNRPKFSVFVDGNNIIVRALRDGSSGNQFRFDPIVGEETISFFSTSLIGGTDTAKSRIRIPIDYSNEIIPGISFIETTEGFCRIRHIAPYLDEPVFVEGELVSYKSINEFAVVSLDDPDQTILVTRNENSRIYNYSKIEIGLLSFYGFKDFDFDFNSSEYGEFQEFEYDRYFDVKQLQIGNSYTVYKEPANDDDVSIIHDGTTYIHGETFTAVNDSYEVTQGVPVIIDDRFKYDEELQSFVGFRTLNPPLDQEPEEIFVNTDLIQNKILALNRNVTSEYEYLRELNKLDLITKSRVVPDINKWVSALGNDVRGNPYRLNLSRAFGELNFTPSFFDKTQNANYYTHEWYYLGSQPENISEADILQSRDYFTVPFRLDRYASNTTDYFSQYFTLDNLIFEKENEFRSIPITRQVRYSEIRRDRGNRYISFFKGVQLEIVGLNEGDDISRFDDYKFSALLRVEKTEYLVNKPAVDIQLIEHERFRNLVLLITVTIDDYKVFPDLNSSDFLDYTTLYSLSSLKRYNPSLQGYDLGLEFPLPEIFNVDLFNSQGGVPVPPRVTTFRGVQTSLVIDYSLYTGNPDVLRYQDRGITVSNFIKPIILWDNTLKELSDSGELGRIFGIDTNGFLTFTSENVFFSPTEYLYDRENTIDNIISNTDVRLRPSGLALVNNPGQVSNSNFDPVDLNDNIYDLSEVLWFYENGGANIYDEPMQSISFASIFDDINTNKKLIKYRAVKSTGAIEDGGEDFELIINQPNLINRERSLTINPTNEILPEIPNESVVVYSNGISETPHKLRRYGGGYVPKTKDVLIFRDEFLEMKWALSKDRWVDASYTWLRSQSSQIQLVWGQVGETWLNTSTSWNNLKVEKENINSDTIPFSDILLGQNTKFDVNNDDFGIIQNHWVHRVNSNDRTILKSPTPRYPSIDEIGIEARDVFVFNSDWVHKSYIEFADKFDSRFTHGTNNLLDIKSYLASKVLALEDTIELSGFSVSQDVIDIKLVDTYTTGIVWQIIDNRLSLYLDVANRLTDVIFERSSAEFDNYLKPYNVTTTSVELAIREYIRGNIIPVYKIRNIKFYIRTYDDANLNLELFTSGQDEITLIENGYTINRNLAGTTVDDLSTIFNYSIPDGSQVSIGLFVTVDKI